MDPKTHLLDQLVRYAYQYRPEEPFLLASGETSAEYLDCRLALSQPGAMAALGEVILGMLNPEVVAIGGLTMGADPLAMSTCQASAAGGRAVRWFSVRKEPKVHGQQKWIEGFVKSGEFVAIVDDVVTKGTSTIKAVECCRDYGLQIAQVIVLVDREEQGGIENVRAQAGSARVEVVFAKKALREQWEREQSLQHVAPNGVEPVTQPTPDEFPLDSLCAKATADATQLRSPTTPKPKRDKPSCGH